MLIHPQEALAAGPRLQQSTHYDEYRVRRVVVEHRLARLVQLGIRQSRYFGRVKTRFQLYLAATVANLTLHSGGRAVPAAAQQAAAVPTSPMLRGLHLRSTNLNAQLARVLGQRPFSWRLDDPAPLTMATPGPLADSSSLQRPGWQKL